MSLKGYNFSDSDFEITAEMKSDFDENGFLLIRNLLSAEEVKKICGHLENSKVIPRFAYGVDDGGERQSRMCLWNQPGNDLTGILSRCDKMAGTCDKLLQGETYHYHTKLMMKEAFTGGRWNWHQDYGYWYKNTCLFPDMLTVFIALDPCNPDNGCLQVIPGSHKLGRLDHVISGDQVEVEKERLQLILDKMEPRYVIMEPGDGLFFHCNLLHTSSQNQGPNRRWALAIAYNRASNDPVRDHHHPKYTKWDRVPSSAIMACPDGDLDVENKDMFDKSVRDEFRMRLKQQS